MVKQSRGPLRTRFYTFAPLLTAAVLAGLMAIEAPSSSAEHQISAPITAGELAGIHGLSAITISPDGKLVAVQVDHQDLASNTTILDWFIAPMNGGPAVRVASGGAPRFGVNGGLATERAQWSPDGRWIYYTALNGEDVQVWRARSDGKKVEQVTHDAADIIAFEVSADGSVIYSAAGATRAEIKAAEQQAYDAGVVIDQTVIPGFPLIRSFPYNGRMATLRVPKPNSFFRMTLLGDRPVRFMRQTPGVAKATPAPQETSDRYEASWEAGTSRFGSAGAGRFLRTAGSTDADGLIITAPGGERIARLSTNEHFIGGDRPNPSGQELAWSLGDTVQAICTSPACMEADGLTLLGWTSDASGIVFQTLRQGREAIQVWAVGANEVRTLAEHQGSFGGMWSGRFGTCELSREAVVCIAAAPEMSPRLIAIDLRTGKQTLLLNPNPALTASRLARTETLLLHDSFGSVAWARLFLPRDWSTASGRLPLVLTSYNCDGFPLGGAGEDVPEQVLVGRGYAALCVDSNSWNVHRPASFDPSQKDVNQSSFEFFEDGVRVLDTRGIIDPGRVAVTGFSGSSTAIALGLSHSETFTTAIVTTQTSADPMICYYLAQAGNCRRMARSLGDQPPYDGRNSFLKNSTALNAKSVVTPLFMQLSDVEYPSMMQLYGALGDFDRAFELRVYPDEFHIKRQPRHRLNVYERNLDWIEFWLRGQETSAADQGAQYIRWRKLREGQCKMIAARPPGSMTPWYCNQASAR